MDIETATSATASLISTGSFWEHIPAAAYVLLGVVISGCFNLFVNNQNHRNNKELKELENKNNKELKEIETKNTREAQVLEIAYKEKAQKLKEEGDKALRLLDDKLKVFSDFHNDYSEILLSGTHQSRMEKIEALRKSVYKVRLLAPSIGGELFKLDTELKEYGNYYFDILNNGKTFSEEEATKFCEKMNLVIGGILKSLSDKL